MKNPIATIKMNSGKKIVIELMPECAPNTVNSFIYLAEKGLFDNREIKRIVPGFVIQPTYDSFDRQPECNIAIEGEFRANGFENNLKIEKGVVALGGDGEKISGSSCFFITLSDEAGAKLDGKFAGFGKVIKGYDEVCLLYTSIKGFGQQGRVLGICGGYQMLGRKLIDPHHVESESDEEEGLGLLPVDTEFTMDKRTTRVNGVIPEETIGNNRALNVYGYEIHMGTTKSYTEEKKLVNINQCNGKIYEMTEGNVNEKGNVIGTYLHGIFDGIEFRQHIANTLRRTKKLKERQSIAYESVRDKEIDRLADVVRLSLIHIFTAALSVE